MGTQAQNPESDATVGAELGRPRRAAAVAIVAVVALAVGWLLAPRPVDLGTVTTGDAELAERVRALAGDAPHRGMAVALVEDGATRVAGLGTTGGAAAEAVHEHTPFETGSVTKVFTGMLLASLEEDGRLSRDTPLGEVYPGVSFSDPRLAEVTLAQLSNHLSGLPSAVPAGLAGYLRTLGSTWIGLNPVGAVQPDDVLDAATTVTLGDPGTPVYPNFAASLLGHALAEHERSTYADLVAARLVEPLGLTATTVQTPDEGPPTGHARPQRSSGAQVDAWIGSGELPSGAGGLWSTASDLARLAVATRDGSAPGATAAEPHYEHTPRTRLGLGWITTDHDGRAVTWHNGATDGTATFVGFTDDAAVVVLATGGPLGTRSVDSLALRLLGIDSDQNTGLDARFYPMLGVTALLAPLAALSLLRTTMRSGGREQRRPVDRVGLGAQLAWCVLLLALVWRAGFWDRVPPLVWVGSVGVVGAGLAIAALRWARLPTIATGPPWRRVAGLAFPLLAVVAYGATLITTLAGL